MIVILLLLAMVSPVMAESCYRIDGDTIIVSVYGGGAGYGFRDLGGMDKLADESVKIADAQSKRIYNVKVQDDKTPIGHVDIMDAQSRQQHSAPYAVINSTYFVNWTVIKGSQTYELSDFVSSGKFCEWNLAHIYGWYIDTKCPHHRCCGLCGKCESSILKAR